MKVKDLLQLIMIYAQISSSVGTGIFALIGAILVILSRCLYVKFSEMELFPHDPQPNVLVTANPFWIDPPAVVADGALTTNLDTLSSLPALMIFP